MPTQPQTKTPAAPRNTKTPGRAPAPAPSPGGGGGLDLGSLSSLAQHQAQAQVDATVAAIRAQQQQELQQAQDQAAQIALASQAGAKFLTGLGQQTFGNYQDAAKTLAGLSSGYSGQLQQDAGADAAKIQQGLDQAHAGTVANAAPQLGNVLYGMRGVQPAAALLSAGAGAAQGENALPAAIIGHGQELGVGALGGARQAVEKLAPDIANAYARMPSIQSTILKSLIDQATGQQKLQLQALLDQSLIQSRQDATRLAGQRLDVQTQYENAQLGLSSQRLQQQQDQFIARQKQTVLKGQQPNPTLSKTVGYLVDSSGNPILVGGKPKVLPGFKLDRKTGQIVKVGGAGGGPKPATQGELKTFLDSLPQTSTSSIYDKTTGTRVSAKSTVPGQYRLQYGAAYTRLRGMGLDDLDARRQLDTIYPRGSGGRSWITNEEQAVLRSVSPSLLRVGTYKIRLKGGKTATVGYLTPQQVAVLNAHGQLPPGERVPAPGNNGQVSVRQTPFGTQVAPAPPAWVYAISPNTGV